jgi:hypothetical protein
LPVISNSLVRQPDVARQPVDRSRATEQRAPDVVVPDPGLIGDDREVAGDHQLEPAGHRVSLHDRDGRLGQAERAAPDPGRHLRDLHGVVGRAEELGVQHLQVGACAERMPAAADQHHPHVRVPLGPLQRLAELLQQRPVDAVLHLRAVQPDRRDPVSHFVLHEIRLGSHRFRLQVHAHRSAFRHPVALADAPSAPGIHYFLN